MITRILTWLLGPRRSARGIFRFWDGQKERNVDPFEILRAIENDPEFVLERDSAMMIAGHDNATQRTVRCVRRAFGVKHFNDGGLLEAECLQLIEAFYEYLNALKKNTSEPPTSSQPTAPESSTTSTDPVVSSEPPAPGSSSSDSPKMPTEAS